MPSSAVYAVDADFGEHVAILDAKTGHVSHPVAGCDGHTSNSVVTKRIAEQMGVKARDPCIARAEDDHQYWEGCCSEYQFSDRHYAILLKPGDYGDLSFGVGFYTQVMGLGEARGDVRLASVNVNYGMPGPGGDRFQTQQNFWRGVENLSLTQDFTWLVSQAASARRLAVNGGYEVCQVGGWGSGGYFADMEFTGCCKGDTVGQQWFFRNMKSSGQLPASKNTTSVGSILVDGRTLPGGNVVVEATPVIAEKPHLTFDPNTGLYYVVVYESEHQKKGPTHDDHVAYQQAEKISVTKDMLVNADMTAAEINRRIASNQAVVFLPGIYYLEAPIEVMHSGCVLLGLGLPTLTPTTASNVLNVKPGLCNVRVAGFILQAGSAGGDALLCWGEEGQTKIPGTEYSNFLYDIYPLIGGKWDGAVNSALVVHEDNVILDHIWIWRADHDHETGQVVNKNPVNFGLVVRGQGVKVYGLFVEHVLGRHVLWTGDRGLLYFLQTEVPQDARPGAPAALDECTYEVAEEVRDHEARGVGIYSLRFNDDFGIQQQYAMKLPRRSEGGIVLEHIVVWYHGTPWESIERVLNSVEPSDVKNSERICAYYRNNEKLEEN
eukprot:TRINITY_DN106857_c0_g1_i1.p1 TRINITY_DN106857_c0_g1~~TRINITY_DN106857_c0_g1_i1.p1  ORF type:complete len:631 (+),score=118.05 TRINITY_DN106857_c0_g1_i1:80-1894(+)